MDLFEQFLFGVKEDPEDSGLKGDMQAIKKGQANLQKWVVRVGLFLAAVLLITRYPELGKFILKLAGE